MHVAARTIFQVTEGRIVFSGLRVDSASSNVRLSFEAGNAIGPVSSPTGFIPFPSSQVPRVSTSWFHVVVGKVGKIVVLVQPGGCSLDANRQGLPCTQTPIVELRDSGGNAIGASDREVTRVLMRA
jgi:hypothetical protein